MRHLEYIISISNLKLLARTLVMALLVVFPITAQANWQTEWEKTLSAAKREGRVVVAGSHGEVFRQALTAFQQAYPEIKLEFSAASGRDWAPKILAEREAGKYLWDVYVSGSDTPNAVLKPRGVFEPLRSALILPEILDDSKWLGGFNDGWMDNDRQFIYGFAGRMHNLVYINREFISETELNSVDQLLDPKWRGKISWNEPQAAGGGSAVAAYWLVIKGEDWVRQLLAHGVVITRDLRQQVEWLVRGRYPVGIGTSPRRLLMFHEQGIGLKVEALAPRTVLGSRLSAGPGNVMLFNRAPSPNAAKVYINWLLSKAGQTQYVKVVDENSRRLDVPGPSESAPDPKIQYINVNKEQYLPYMKKARDLAKEVFGK
jgi:iron(III) transport system substrate-binding protein